MKKIILIVEDLKEEQQKAKDAVTASGCSPVVAENLEDATRIFSQLKSNLFGVVTDLHYPSSHRFNKTSSDKPNGLAMVALCVESGVRVGVCSDVNHHYSEYLKIPIRVLMSHQSYSFSLIPFSEDNKDWEIVLKKLLTL